MKGGPLILPPIVLAAGGRGGRLETLGLCVRRFALPAAFVAAVVLLAAALVHSMYVAREPLWVARLSAVVLGLVAGVARPRLGVLAVIVASPLVDVVGRLSGAHDLYLTDHMLIPMLLGAAVLVCRRAEIPRAGAIGWPLAIFCLLAIVSAALGLWEYRDVHQSLWAMLVSESERHFNFSAFDLLRGSFGLLHGVVILVQGALWFVLLTSPALGLRSASLRGALVLSVVLVGLAGVAQSIWPIGLPEFFRRVQPNLIRINSTFPDPNTFGSFLILVGPLAVVAAWRSPGGRAVGLGMLALLGYCLVQTVSRSAWVGLAGALAVASVLVGWRSQALGLRVSPLAVRMLRRAIYAGAVAVALAVFVVTFGALGGGISQKGARSPIDMLVFSLDLRRPVDDLLPARVDHWRAAVGIWGDFPMFGAGVGKYIALKRRYLPDTKLPFFTEAHNYYLKTLSELGVVGLVAFLGILLGIADQARRAWSPEDPARQARVAAIGIGLLAFALGSLAQDPLNLSVMQRTFWALAALLVLETREAPQG